MQCLAPITIKNPAKKKSANSPAFVTVPCGKCAACVLNKRTEWFIRCKEELKHSHSCLFVTLTYDDEHLPIRYDFDGVVYHDVNKRDVQLYHKRLRKQVKTKFKFFLTSEYGEQFHRPHYHALYFNFPLEKVQEIAKAWQNGFVKVDFPNDDRIKYVTGYVINKLTIPEGCNPIFNLISKNLGIDYVKEFALWHRRKPIERCFYPCEKTKRPLPRYYKEKIYSHLNRQVIADNLSNLAYQREQEDINRMGISDYERQKHAIRQQTTKQVLKDYKHKHQNF